MNQITIRIDGMICGMCEAHLCDTVRRAFPEAKKVRASRKSGNMTFLCDIPIDEDRLRRAIAETGYTPLSVLSEPYCRRFPFGK